MSRNINIWTSNWHATGSSPKVPQYSVDVRIDWIDDAGVEHTHSQAILFPNCLQTFGAEDLKAYLTELILREVRQRLGVDL